MVAFFSYGSYFGLTKMYIYGQNLSALVADGFLTWGLEIHLAQFCMKTSRWGECCFSRNLSSALVYSCSGHLGTLFAVLPKLLERSAHRICMCIDLKHLFCIKAMTIFCQTKLFYALISIIMGRLKSTGLSCLFVWILKYRIILSLNHTQKAITGTSCLFNVYMSILSVHIITSRIITLMTDLGNKLCYERVRAITPLSLLICNFLYLSNTCVFDHAHGHAQSLPFWICIFRLQQQKICPTLHFPTFSGWLGLLVFSNNRLLCYMHIHVCDLTCVLFACVFAVYFQFIHHKRHGFLRVLLASC